MDTKWLIENWINEGGVSKITLFHNHNNYKVFILEDHICSLCKEKVPNYILFQFKLISNSYWDSNRNIFIQKNQKYFYEYRPNKTLIEVNMNDTGKAYTCKKKN